ncbi:MAG: hypothetical protein ABJG68_16800 [Crocinitomicaceae bacterium]
MKFYFIIVFLTYQCLGIAQSIAYNEKALNRAKNSSDSVLTAFFGSENMSQSIRWNKSKSFVNCQTKSGIKLHKFSEKFEGKITFYDLTYEIIIGKDMVFELRIDCSPNFACALWSGSYWQGKFNAYKKLLNGDFKVNFQNAISIGIEKGIAREFISAELNLEQDGNIENLDDYYWEVKDFRESNSQKSIYQINVSTGKVSEKKEVLIHMH